MPSQWQFRKTDPHGVRRSDVLEDTFSPEDREAIEILVREAIQNSLDARSSPTDPVRVSFHFQPLSEAGIAMLKTLFPQDYMGRLAASGKPLDPSTSPGVLLIEDEATTGLIGQYDNPDARGDKENWNAFWLMEGEGAKTGPSNGGAGQGKVMLYRFSQVRAVFGLTVRSSDQARLLMGRSTFQKFYSLSGASWNRDAFWCSGTDLPVPEQDPAFLDDFCTAFGVSRKGNPGLSLLIPYPVGFDSQNALKVVISEFYFPIIQNRLVVQVNGTVVDASSARKLSGEIKPSESEASKGNNNSPAYRSFLDAVADLRSSGKQPITLSDGWEKSTTLADTHLPGQDVAGLRDSFSSGNLQWFRCPLTLRSKTGSPENTTFDVFLQLPEDLQRPEEAYLRQDLLIGGEVHLKETNNLQYSRALTHITDPKLVGFLGLAELPTHLKWNTRRPNIEELFTPNSISLNVKAVRLAAPRLVSLLLARANERDLQALAKYFWHPGDVKPKETPESKEKSPGKTKAAPDTPELPPAKKKPVILRSGKDWIEVSPGDPAALAGLSFPLECTLELAYDCLEGDPFTEYDPFDFNLADSEFIPTTAKSVSVISRQNNRCRFSIDNPSFTLKIQGFDTNLRLRARLAY